MHPAGLLPDAWSEEQRSGRAPLVYLKILCALNGGHRGCILGHQDQHAILHINQQPIASLAGVAIRRGPGKAVFGRRVSL